MDLEAVLWLQEYLKGYKHTVLLVSHDRAFLNEVWSFSFGAFYIKRKVAFTDVFSAFDCQQVCTDVVDFANKTLTYYRGNYDTYEAVRGEKIKNQVLGSMLLFPTTHQN